MGDAREVTTWPEPVRALAQCLGYERPTELQRLAFAQKGALEGRDLFVVGSTSSGKTLIPLLLYYRELTEAHAAGRRLPKLLFTVPFRTLAAQKLQDITRELAQVRAAFGIAEELRCEQSTGEFRQADGAVRRGEVDVAVAITEKVYLFASEDPAFLSRYDYLVFDEAGLIEDDHRGGKFDLLLSWAHEQRRLTAASTDRADTGSTDAGDRGTAPAADAPLIAGTPRMIALGTPAFDWSAYVHAYGFLETRTTARPVPLEEHVVSYRRTTSRTSFSLTTDAGNPALSTCTCLLPAWYGRAGVPASALILPCAERDGEPCSIHEPARSDARVSCPQTGAPCSSRIVAVGKTGAFDYLLEQICRHHLKQGHQILIFKNNREEIRRIARMLWERLGSEVAPAGPELRAIAADPERARERILAATGLEADDLYGIMEDTVYGQTLYQALVCGIGFHSAAVPYELRAYVEEGLLGSRGLKIVCSTETLAYGVNSAVDVVVVADIFKQLGYQQTPLTPNELQNYIGRAGRLRADRPAQDNRGYAYTLLNERSGKHARDHREDYRALRRAMERPAVLYSRLFDTDNDQLPFFLLNLMPPEGRTTWRAIKQAVATLPKPEEGAREQGAGDEPGGTSAGSTLNAQVNEALAFLQNEGLIADIDPEDDFGDDAWGEGGTGADPGVPECALTPLGRRLRGYVIGRKDYKTILYALREAFVGSDGIDEVTLLFKLLASQYLQTNPAAPFKNAPDKWNAGQILRELERRMKPGEFASAPWLDDLRACPPNQTAVCKRKPHDLYYSLMALLGWMNGWAPNRLYANFGLQYPLVQRMAERVAYLLEICIRTASYVIECVDSERAEQAARSNNHAFGILAQLQEARLNTPELIEQAECQLKELHLAVLHGIDRRVRSRMIEELELLPGDAAHELAETYRNRIDPVVARQLRRIGVRYHFFERQPPAADASVEERNNYRNQRDQYLEDLRAMPRPIQQAFSKLFALDLDGGA